MTGGASRGGEASRKGGVQEWGNIMAVAEVAVDAAQSSIVLEPATAYRVDADRPQP